MKVLAALRERLALLAAKRGTALFAIALLGLAARTEWQCQTSLDDALDGAFYYQTARHVSEGDGLVTSVSLYHEALSPLPRRSGFYPLWPLVLGAAGALVGMEQAGWLLPRLLYLLNLLLLYLLAQRIAHRLGWGRPFGPRIPIGPGHLALAVLAMNPVFRWSTTRTYTEGLAMLLVMGTLIAFDRGLLDETPRRHRWFGLAGFLAGAACATRYQLAAIGPTLALVRGLGPRLGRRRDLLNLLLGSALPFALVVAHVASAPGSHVTGGPPAWLPPYTDQIPTTGFWGYFADRLAGLAVAYSPWSEQSYWFQHGPLVLAPPFVLLWLLWRPRAIPAVVRTWLERRHAAMTATAVCAVMTLLPVHALHFNHWDPWVFGWRQGLPFLWLALPALAYLVSRPIRGARLLGLLCVLGSVAWGAQQEIPNACQVNHPRIAARRELASWLDRQTPLPTIMGIEPQPLGVYSRAGMHWIACWSPPSLAQALAQRLAIDYLVIEGAGILECPSLSLLRDRLVLETEGKSTSWPYWVFRIGPDTVRTGSDL
jgi:hypothetical protein